MQDVKHLLLEKESVYKEERDIRRMLLKEHYEMGKGEEM